MHKRGGERALLDFPPRGSKEKKNFLLVGREKGGEWWGFLFFGFGLGEEGETLEKTLFFVVSSLILFFICHEGEEADLMTGKEGGGGEAVVALLPKKGQDARNPDAQKKKRGKGGGRGTSSRPGGEGKKPGA